MAVCRCQESGGHRENGRRRPVHCKQDRLLAGIAPLEGARWNDTGRIASFFRNAPVCIGVFATQYISVMDRPLMARESFDPEAREIMAFRRSAPTAVQSAAAAVTTMLLAFHQMGLGAVWLGAPLMAKKEIESILKVSKDLSLVCLVAVGYPDEFPKKDRNPVDQVLEFVR